MYKWKRRLSAVEGVYTISRLIYLGELVDYESSMQAC